MDELGKDRIQEQMRELEKSREEERRIVYRKKWSFSFEDFWNKLTGRNPDGSRD